MQTYAIIMAAGKGQRMGANVNKIFLLLNGESIIAHTVRTFQNNKQIDKILIVAREEDLSEVENIISKNKFFKVINIVAGGTERQDSVFSGLSSLNMAKENDIVLIHNAANPFVDDNAINNCIEVATKTGACIVGFRAKDTLKRIDENDNILETISRDNLWQAQTPQAFSYKVIMKAHAKAKKAGFIGTDDAGLVEKIGYKVKMIECSSDNIKITSPEDLALAENISTNSLVGLGLDSHRFLTEGEKPLVLGGVIIEDQIGFQANSDGDVILHALFNAISQSLGLNSIGKYADPLCAKGEKNSTKYIEIILQKMKKRGYSIGNIGIICEGKTPNISEHESKIKSSIARLCRMSKTKIGITATSGEDLTSFGRSEGMQCFCIVKLDKK